MVNTLTSAAREYLELRRPKTFKDAVDTCMVYANTKKSQQSAVEANNTENLYKKKFCTFCKHSGHLYQDCRKRKKRNDEKKEQQDKQKNETANKANDSQNFQK